MYAITVSPPCGIGSVIERRMSSNTRIDCLAVVKAICAAEYKMVEPLALRMEDGHYRVFEQGKPYLYAEVTIVKEDT